jgi:FixJ family two-component response regulator
MTRQPTVFLVDPDGATREGIKRISSMMDVNFQTFATGQEFLAAFDPDVPGCAVLEIKIPGINGLQIQQRLRDSGVTLPVIFVSAAPSVSIAVHAMRAGALHFLEKPVRENDLWSALQEAIQLDQKRREAQLAHREVNQRIGNLSEKEQTVLELIGDGWAKQAIARELGVSVRTVEHYRTQLMRKLATNSLTGLMQLALSHRNHTAPTNGSGNFRLVGLNH